MTLREAQSIFTKNVANLVQFAYIQGYELTFGETFRTPEQQKIYLASGKSKTQNSQHLKRLAVDFNVFVRGTLVKDTALISSLGAFWVSLHPLNRWGGDWNRNGKTSDETFLDGNHFEMKF